jgi:pyruvate,orthophosphate dikinase
MAKTKQVYYFGKIRCDGNHELRDLLGGKGADLAEMVRIGLPVPPGFTKTTLMSQEVKHGIQRLL